jgi:hypothetical protein
MGHSLSRKTKTPHKKVSPKQAPVTCTECSKSIPARDQALFVEEEVGRVFCSEACIVAHFTPDIEKLEREYGRHVSANELSASERERYAHLRWLTLEQPSELWVEQTKAGDYRYTVIGEFKPDPADLTRSRIWGVAVCLMLRQEPSFLFLAFVTGDRQLVDVFRRGTKLKLIQAGSENGNENVDSDSSSESRNQAESSGESAQAVSQAVSQAASQDRLADSWTEADSVRAQIIKNRTDNDIPVEDFGFYQNCLEETLQEPTELWSFLPKAAKRVYHFIKRYEHDQAYWYVVIARDTTDETQIEIVDAFPTRDEGLVQACRHGKKEILEGSREADAQESEIFSAPQKKTVH